MSRAGREKRSFTKIMYCPLCESIHISNRKKKCCGEDLEECGFIEEALGKQPRVIKSESKVE